MVGDLAGLHRALDARTDSLLAEHAYQVPAALRDLGDLGDRLHLLDAADADFRNPKRAADVRPLLTRLGGLHRSAAVGAELALGFDS